MRARSAARVIPFRFGHAYFNWRFPHVWDLNTVCVEAQGDVDPGEIASDAELLHSDAGHAYRRVQTSSDDVGAACAPFLRRLRWESDRLVHMVYRGGGEHDTGSVRVDEIPVDELRDFREEIGRSEPWAESDEVVSMLLDANALWSKVGSGRHFAVREGGRVVSATDLYSDGRTAQVEDVATSPDHRGKGLASRSRAARRRRGAGLGPRLRLPGRERRKPGAGAVRAPRLRDRRPHLELPQEARPDGADPYLISRRAGPSACLSSSTSEKRSPSRSTRPSTTSIVKAVGSRSSVTSSHRSGVETGAPALGRTE